MRPALRHLIDIPHRADHPDQLAHLASGLLGWGRFVESHPSGGRSSGGKEKSAIVTSFRLHRVGLQQHTTIRNKPIWRSVAESLLPDHRAPSLPESAKCFSLCAPRPTTVREAHAVPSARRRRFVDFNGKQ